MHPAIARTFGGLNKKYYFRQFVIALILSTIYISFLYSALARTDMGRFSILAFITILNSVLYPYSRFVYKSVVSFFLGDNFVFFISSPFILFFLKIVPMLFCFSMA